jgi:DNA-binding IclR family transcriptional regulator
VPPRHHRTVDRVVAILEMVARNSRGMTLTAVSQTMGAPKSSVQELTNGLIAAGYLVERDGRLTLGSGPFVLSLMGNRIAALGLRHEMLEELHRALGHSVMVGIGVGDSLVYIDQVGVHPALEFVARNHSRRSLYATASGKIILAEMPPREMDAFLMSAPVNEAADVQAFLKELPSIRATRLAYNMGATVPDAIAVATPMTDAKGAFIASVCVAVEPDLEGEIEQIGKDLRGAVAALSL